MTISTRIIRIDPRELKLLDLNARYMKHEEYNRLVENIRRDGCLTSVPLACLEDNGQYLVLSGNHRTKAAMDAGLEAIDIMVTDDPLPKNRRLALQLAHNSIVGKDDPAILKQLYEDIDDIDWKVYAGLDDKTLELLESVKPASLSEAGLEFQVVQSVFLPDELARAQEIIDTVKKQVNGDQVFLNRHADYDRWLDAIDEAGAAHNVKNTATAISIILDVFERHKTDLAQGWTDGESIKHKKAVPLSSIFGTEKVPAALALTIKKVVDNMIASGQIDRARPWQALEELCGGSLK